jgi:hypothetical protein
LAEVQIDAMIAEASEKMHLRVNRGELDRAGATSKLQQFRFLAGVLREKLVASARAAGSRLAGDVLDLLSKAKPDEARVREGLAVVVIGGGAKALLTRTEMPVPQRAKKLAADAIPAAIVNLFGAEAEAALSRMKGVTDQPNQARKRFEGLMHGVFSIIPYLAGQFRRCLGNRLCSEIGDELATFYPGALADNLSFLTVTAFMTAAARVSIRLFRCIQSQAPSSR